MKGRKERNQYSPSRDKPFPPAKSQQESLTKGSAWRVIVSRPDQTIRPFCRMGITAWNLRVAVIVATRRDDQKVFTYHGERNIIVASFSSSPPSRRFFITEYTRTMDHTHSS